MKFCSMIHLIELFIGYPNHYLDFSQMAVIIEKNEKTFSFKLLSLTVYDRYRLQYFPNKSPILIVIEFGFLPFDSPFD